MGRNKGTTASGNPKSVVYLREDLDLFSQHGYDVSILNSNNAKFHPSSNLQDATTPITFIVPGTDTHYVDLGETRLHLRLKVTDATGGNIGNTNVVAPVNNLLHSLFSQVKLYLNETLITPPSTYYGYKAFIERLLLFTKEYHKSQSTQSMYYKERDPNNTDTANVTDTSYSTRVNLASGSKVFEVIGRLHLDLFNQAKYLPPSFDLRLEMLRATDDFVVHCPTPAGGAEYPKYKIIIQDAVLHMVRRKVLPALELMHINEWKSHKVMNYDLKRTDVKSFSMGIGTHTTSNSTMISGLLPNRLILGLVETSNLVGTSVSNPFYFGSHDLSYIKVTMNGDGVESYPLDVNFADANNLRVMEAYDNLFKGLGLCNSPCSIDYTLDEFKQGKTLFVYELKPVSDAESLPLHGFVEIELKFKSPTTKALTLLAYTETQGTLHIDHMKNVYYKDYSQAST